jgi:hypothetical protein
VDTTSGLTRRLAARIRGWNWKWAAAALLFAAWAVGVGADGDVFTAAYLGLASAVLLLLADRSGSSTPRLDPAVTEADTRAGVRQLWVESDSIDPEMLATAPAFQAASARLADKRFPVGRRIALSEDPDAYFACAALAALARRPDLPRDWTNTAIRRLRTANDDERFFLLDALAAGRRSRSSVSATIAPNATKVKPRFVKSGRRFAPSQRPRRASALRGCAGHLSHGCERFPWRCPCAAPSARSSTRRRAVSASHVRAG